MRSSINISDAVNHAASLNRGLVSWYLTLPDQQRGNVFRDLMMRNHGILTGAPTWSGMAHAGGHESLALVGASSQYVPLLSSTQAAALTTGTIACWARMSGTTASYPSIIGCGLGNAADKDGVIIAQTPIADNSKVYAQVRNDSGTFGTYAATAANTGTDGLWHHFTLTYTLTALEFYMDGKSLGTDSGASGAFSPQELEIGRRNDDSYFYWTGNINDVRIYNRYLTTSEVQSLYRASSQGYPGELNWRRRRGVIEQAVSSSPSKNIPLRGGMHTLFGGLA